MVPRNGTGTYTLPRPPFVPGTVISSADVNADFSDIAAALTASLAANGETSITGQLRGLVSATPMWSFVSDTDTGFGSDTADQAYVRAGGTKTLAVNTTGIVVTGTGSFSGALTVVAGGMTVTAGGLTITAGGVAVAAGGAAITGNSTVTGTFLVTGVPTFSSTSHMVPPAGTTAQRPTPAAGQLRYNTTLNYLEWYTGTVWAGSQLPTFTRLTSGTGLTYNTPAGCRRLKIKMCGGGGSGASNTTAGNAGNTTTFGTWTAVGASAAAAGAGLGGVGGTGGTNGTGTLIVRQNGGNGGGGFGISGGINAPGLAGGTNRFGGAGIGSIGNGDGYAGVANTGAGGGGCGHSNNTAAAGGGAGEYVEFYIDSPGASFTYTVAASVAGVAGSSTTSGAGAAGVIEIEEIY